MTHPRSPTSNPLVTRAALFLGALSRPELNFTDFLSRRAVGGVRRTTSTETPELDLPRLLPPPHPLLAAGPNPGGNH